MVKLFKTFFSVKGIKLRTLLQLILLTLGSVIEARITIWISQIVTGASKKQMIEVTEYLQLLIIGLIIKVLITYVASRLYRHNRDIVYTEAMNWVVEKVLSVDYDVFTKYDRGQIDGVISGMRTISSAGNVLARMLSAGVDFLVITISICLIEIRLLIPILVIYSISAVVINKIWHKCYVTEKEATEIQIKRDTELDKIISGFNEVRSNCTEEYHLKDICNMNYECRNKFFSKAKALAVDNTIMDIINSIITLVVVMYSIIMIPQGLVSSLAMSLVIYSGRLLDPLTQMMDVIDGVSSIKTKFEKFDEFMNIENKVLGGEIELKEFESNIQFNNVEFGYEDSNTVLKDINLTIRKGEKVGICGSSGGGKSTLLKLVSRFYDVVGGSITIDNIDIRDLTIHSLRSHIGIVSQSNYIFKGSIYDNVVYGMGNVTHNEVEEACKKAGIYNFIMSLENRFDTEVGPKGLKLSGGQQQRISLARIFLRDPDIILLDEATSALDNESEAIVQESLKLFADKTIITVAHRLSTIQDSDKIVVIDSHKIAEVGTHDQLMESKGIYYGLQTAKE